MNPTGRPKTHGVISQIKLVGLSFIGAFHFSTHEHIRTIELINIHYLYIIVVFVSSLSIIRNDVAFISGVQIVKPVGEGKFELQFSSEFLY